MMALVLSVPQARSDDPPPEQYDPTPLELAQRYNSLLQELTQQYRSSVQGSKDANQLRGLFVSTAKAAQEQMVSLPPDSDTRVQFRYSEIVLDAMKARAQQSGNLFKLFSKNPPLLDTEQGLSLLVLAPLSDSDLQQLIERPLKQLDPIPASQAKRELPFLFPIEGRLINHFRAQVALAEIFYGYQNPTGGFFSRLYLITNEYQARVVIAMLQQGFIKDRFLGIEYIQTERMAQVAIGIARDGAEWQIDFAVSFDRNVKEVCASLMSKTPRPQPAPAPLTAQQRKMLGVRSKNNLTHGAE